MNSKNLVIRADASPTIGTGHVMRCLALAQVWQDYEEGYVIFILGSSSPLLEKRLIQDKNRIIHIHSPVGSMEDAEETARIAQQYNAEWIVIDGYNFDYEYQKIFKNNGFSVIFIDDYGHADHYCADIVLNQNGYADSSFYKNYDPSTRFLLGTKYSLIRKEFLKWLNKPRDIRPVVQKILVTLGGSDPDNITLKVIEALKTLDMGGLEVVVVLGGANPHYCLIQEAAKGLSGVTILKNADNMPELMAWADIAISAGGSTCWELLFMGVPSIVIPIAENQKAIANYMRSRNIARVIEANKCKNPSNLARAIMEFIQSFGTRLAFSKKMVHYVDGKGCFRVMGSLFYNNLLLRKVESSDCKKIYEWINDPQVRSVSFHSEPISLEHHREWFFSAIANPSIIYYIAVSRNMKQIGQVRFKIELQEAIISVLIDPRFRGISLGSLLIQDATEKFFNETGIKKVKAYIKKGNESSRKAFCNAGYQEQGDFQYNEENAFILIKTREKK